MPLCSAFSPPGHYYFSSRKPRGQIIYESLRDGQGDTYEESFDSRQGARCYADAMCLASADLLVRRAGNNRNPATATELLPNLEADYQVVPPYNATIPERRAALSVRARATRGSRREALEDGLSTLLGSAFVRLQTTAVGDIVAKPNHPGNVGVFAEPGAVKKAFIITVPIALTLEQIAVPFTMIGGGDPPVAGEDYCVDPNSRGAPEKIRIVRVFGSTLVTTFGLAHERGTVAIRPHRLWISNQRQLLVFVTVAAAMDPEVRRKTNEYMARTVRATSQWGITTDAGPLTPDDPVLGHPWVALPT
jgi:hypothetical protein